MKLVRGFPCFNGQKTPLRRWKFAANIGLAYNSKRVLTVY
jgi:hypothetical protein